MNRLLARHRRPVVLAVAVLLASTGYAEDTGNRPEGTDGPAAREEADLLAFIEYLGSWEESDAEWQQFHPDAGVVEARTPVSAGQDEDAGRPRDEKDRDGKNRDERS